MKKVLYILVSLIVCFFSVSVVKAEGLCSYEAAKQLAKIIYKEVGGTITDDKDDNFFVKLATGSVALNNASNKSGSNIYDKMYNLTDGNYEGYSSYKNSSFEDVVDSSARGELLYVAGLVLSGKFNFPKEVTWQSADYIMAEYGAKTFTVVKTYPGLYDVYFGYDNTLGNKDALGNYAPTNPNYYITRAKNLMLSSYSKYNSSSICSLVSNVNSNGGSSGSTTPSTPTTPTNPGTGTTTPTNPGTGTETPSGNQGDTQTTTPVNTGDVVDYNKHEVTDQSCDNLFGTNTDEPGDPAYYIKVAYDVIKYASLVILIVMSIFDFIGAIASQDNDALKKAFNKVIKRFIIMAVIFLLPMLVKFIFKYLLNRNLCIFNE